MRSFTMTSLAHQTGRVADAADLDPVTLTRHGRPRYVILRVEEYERLSARATDPRRILTTADTPQDVLDLLADELAALDEEGR